MKRKINIPAGTNLNDITISQNVNIPLETNSVFQTPIQKAIMNMDVFKKLYDKAKPIDFAYAIHGEIVNDLRHSVKNAMGRERDVFEKQLHKFSPKLEQKIVVLINELFSLAEENGYSFGLFDDLSRYYSQDDNEQWRLVDLDNVSAFLSAFAEKSGLDKTEAQFFKNREMILRQFCSEAIIPKKEDSESILLPFMNLTVEFIKGEITPRRSRKEDYLTYKLPFEYNAEAKAPMYEAFLNQVLPDKDLQLLVHEFIAYALMPHFKLEKAMLLYGSGRNGKSVVHKIVTALLGQKNVSNYSMKSICENNSYSRVHLKDSLLNFSSEIGAGKVEVDMFKKLVSNETIEARYLYKNTFEITKYARLMFNCNTLPKEIENNDAYFGRFLIIPFKETIARENQDPFLANKIIEKELPGVFNLVMEAMKGLIARGKFTKSDLADIELEKYKLESNSVMTFLHEENYTTSIKDNMQNEGFYQIYKNFCISNGFFPLNKNNFNTQLRSLGYRIDRGTAGYFYVWCEKQIILADDLNMVKEILGN